MRTTASRAPGRTVGCRRTGRLLAALLGLMAATGWAAETVLLNEAYAQRCFEAALQGGDRADVETCDKAIEEQPLGTRDLAATHSNRGLLLARLGEYDAALADHDRALALAPELAGLYINRANTHVRARDFRSAFADLERAIELAGDGLPAAYYNRALLFQRLGDRQAARADAQRAAELAPQTLAYRSFAESLASPLPAAPVE